MAASRVEALADSARVFLTVAGVAYGLAVVAELSRYGLLLRNRTILLSPVTVGISDAAVWIAGVFGPLLAIGAAIASAAWLVRARQQAFANAGLRDPRKSWQLLLGSLVPGPNLAFPGVFLSEIVHSRAEGEAPEASTLLMVRIWWVTWILGCGLVAANAAWRFRHSLQAQADGVLLAAFTDAVAVVVVVLTLVLMRRIEVNFSAKSPQPTARWVVAASS